MKKKVLFASAFMLATVGAYAQGNGIAGITEATNMVTSYFYPGTKLIYAVGAVVCPIGGVKVYSKWQGKSTARRSCNGSRSVGTGSAYERLGDDSTLVAIRRRWLSHCGRRST